MIIVIMAQAGPEKLHTNKVQFVLLDLSRATTLTGKCDEWMNVFDPETVLLLQEESSVTKKKS